jgi:hypothetical protein
MAVDLKDHLAAVSSRRTPLWVDAWKYGETLLNKGEEAPWDDLGQLVSLAGKLQNLVASDVLMVEVQCCYDYWTKRHPELLSAMAEKRRLGYALRTLLADQACRAQLHECIDALGNTHSGLPVVLAMSSPRHWMARAYCQAREIESVEVSWEDAESASMYMADFLRAFADCELSGVLLRESPGGGPTNAAELARYQPLINVARHYQWAVVLDNGEDSCATGFGGDEVCFLGADIGEVSGVRVTGLGGQVDFAGLARAGAYCHVRIPADAKPESVLDALDTLRSPVAN